MLADGKIVQLFGLAKTTTGSEKFEGVDGNLDAAAFRALAGAKLIEGRLCQVEFSVRSDDMTAFRDFARKLYDELPPPPTAEERRMISRRKEYAVTLNKVAVQAAKQKSQGEQQFVWATFDEDAGTLMLSTQLCGLKVDELPKGVLGKFFEPGSQLRHEVEQLNFRILACAGTGDAVELVKLK